MDKHFGLYLILTNPAAGYEACAEAAVACGVRYLQLRMKHADRTAIIETAHQLRMITHGTATRLIINDDLSTAMAVEANGLHLGQTDPSLTEARATWNAPGKIFGLSTHTMKQARQAMESAPDYIGVGPVFPTPTKPDADPALGIQQTAEIIRSVPIPAVAIGGINAGNLPDLMKAGIRNFCAVSAVNASADPAAAIRQLQDICKEQAF